MGWHSCLGRKCHRLGTCPSQLATHPPLCGVPTPRALSGWHGPRSPILDGALNNASEGSPFCPPGHVVTSRPPTRHCHPWATLRLSSRFTWLFGGKEGFQRARAEPDPHAAHTALGRGARTRASHLPSSHASPDTHQKFGLPRQRGQSGDSPGRPAWWVREGAAELTRPGPAHGRREEGRIALGTASFLGLGAFLTSQYQSQ